MNVFLVVPSPSNAHHFVAGELNRRTPTLSWHVADSGQHIPSDAFVFSFVKDLCHPHSHYLADSGLWTCEDGSLARAEKVLDEISCNKPETDIPGLIFFLLSRAEEYSPSSRDEWGRFKAEASLLYSKGLHREPFIESRLIPALLTHIQRSFPRFSSPPARPQLIHTFDIDHAYAFYGKPLWRQAGAALKDILEGRFSSLQKRWQSLRSPLHDPFNSYALISRLAEEGRRLICFWQPISGLPPDNNIPLQSAAARQLLRELRGFAEVGLHPSTNHRKNPSALKEEKQMLEKALGKPVTSVRTHFLIMRLPVTYRMMERCGIREDFSMGWTEAAGFRAGTCHPFLFYDRQEKHTGSLLIYPTACMDGVLHDKENLQGEIFLETFRYYAWVTARYGGVFVNHWHNHTIAPEGHWPDGYALFKASLSVLKEYY